MVLFENFCIYDLEKFNLNCFCFCGVFFIVSIDDFICYFKDFVDEGICCFIDVDNMCVVSVFNLGIIDELGYVDNIVIFKLKKIVLFFVLLFVNGECNF